MAFSSDMPRFYLVHWEDRKMSIIEERNIVRPTDCQYEEGDLIEATFCNKIYKAVISEIHHDRKFLSKQAKLPPKHTYEQTLEREKSKGEAAASKRSNTPVKIADSEQPCTQGKTDNSEWSNTPVKTADSEQPRTQGKTADSEQQNTPVETADSEQPRSQGKTADSEQQNTPVETADSEQPRSQGKTADSEHPSTAGKNADFEQSTSVPPTKTTVTVYPSHSHSSSKRSLEKRVEVLEKEVKELRRGLKKARTENEEGAGLSNVRGLSSQDKKVNEVLDLVSHMSPDKEKEINECVKKMCFGVFTKEEMVSCSRTGKKTIRSPDKLRPALDKEKMSVLEKAILKKCPSLGMEAMRKKIDNQIKMTRRSDKKSGQ